MTRPMSTPLNNQLGNNTRLVLCTRRFPKSMRRATSSMKQLGLGEYIIITTTKKRLVIKSILLQEKLMGGDEGPIPSQQDAAASSSAN